MTNRRCPRTNDADSDQQPIDRTAAERFLSRLDGDAESWTFQTFDDNRTRKHQGLARILHGTLETHFETLCSLNRAGAGIFVTVNETDGQGRSRNNIVRIRAVWQEDDGEGTPLPLEPQMVVETSPGKYHRYLLVEGLTSDEHQAVQAVLATHYGSDPAAKDTARVLRLPGFFHCKDTPFRVRLVEQYSGAPYSRETLLATFPGPAAAELHSQPLSDAEFVPPGQRNTFLTSLAGTMRRRGMSQSAIVAALFAENQTRCRPPLETTEVSRIAKSVAQYAPAADAGAATTGLCAILRAATSGDAGAPFEPAALTALSELRSQAPAEYFRFRQQLKRANAGILLSALDRAVANANEGGNAPESVADALVLLVLERAELFHDADGRVYASFWERGHRETWAIDTPAFQEWLSATYYRTSGRAPREMALKDAVHTLAGIGRYQGNQQKVWLRVGVEAKRYFLDLCNADWQAVEVSRDGWQVHHEPAVHFRRTATMRALPYPNGAGDLAPLWDSVNVPEPDRALVLAWMLECWRPETHTPVLELGGEQGSGKSETQARLRDLIDPNEVNLRAAPVRIEDMFVTACNNWLVSFNNLSRLTGPQQDALCVLSTGGGFAARTLYSNAEETVFNTLRPVVVNGIAALATAQDLVDRVVRVELSAIEARRPSSALVADFEAAKPSILGAMLDLFAATLRELPQVSLNRPPRMADFARLGEAMFRALGRKDSFTALYRARREAAVLAALEASPVACAVLDLMQSERVWSGPIKALLRTLAEHRQETDAWPRSPRGLADALRRAVPALRLLGIRVSFEPVRRKDGYHVTLARRQREAGTDPNFSSTGDIPLPANVHHVHQVHPVADQVPDTEQNHGPGERGELGEHCLRPYPSASGDNIAAVVAVPRQTSGKAPSPTATALPGRGKVSDS